MHLSARMLDLEQICRKLANASEFPLLLLATEEEGRSRFMHEGSDPCHSFIRAV